MCSQLTELLFQYEGPGRGNESRDTEIPSRGIPKASRGISHLPTPTLFYPIPNPLLSHLPSLSNVGHTHISFWESSTTAV